MVESVSIANKGALLDDDGKPKRTGIISLSFFSLNSLLVIFSSFLLHDCICCSFLFLLS